MKIRSRNRLVREQEIYSCPFLRASDISDGSSAARVSSYPDSTFSDDNGIMMLSLPDSYCSVPEVTEEEALFHTSHEHSSLLQLSCSEDQNLDEVRGEDARHFDLGSSKMVRSYEGGTNKSVGAGMVYGGRTEAASVEMEKSKEEGLDDVVVGSLESEGNAEDGTACDECAEDREKDILDENIGVMEMLESTVDRDEGEGDKPIEDGEKDILDEDIGLMEIRESMIDRGEGEEPVDEDGEKDIIGENNGLMEIHGDPQLMEVPMEAKNLLKIRRRLSWVNESKRTLEDREKYILRESIWLREMHESTVDKGANKGKRPRDNGDIVTDASRKNLKFAESMNKAEEKNVRVGNVGEKKGLMDFLDVLKVMFLYDDDDTAKRLGCALHFHGRGHGGTN